MGSQIGSQQLVAWNVGQNALREEALACKLFSLPCLPDAAVSDAIVDCMYDIAAVANHKGSYEGLMY